MNKDEKALRGDSPAVPTLWDVVVPGEMLRRDDYWLPATPPEPATTRSPGPVTSASTAEAYLAAHVRQVVADTLPEAMRRAVDEHLLGRRTQSPQDN